MSVDSERANRKRLMVSMFALGLSALSILWAANDSANTRHLSAVVRDPIGIDRDPIGIDRDPIGIDRAQEFRDGERELEALEELQKQKESSLPSLETVSGAIEFILGRREAYHRLPNLMKDELPIANQWKLRGHGYLYNTLNLMLAAEGPNEEEEQVQKGTNVVKIWNVHPKTAQTFQDCSLLTIWVRVNGPEIFAGSAYSVPSTRPNRGCHWEYEFDVQEEGEYEVDVKVVFWNGNAPTKFSNPLQPGGGKPVKEGTMCPDATVDALPPPDVLADSASPYNNGMIGFKFYSPVMSCCEICRRTKGCVHWKTPPEEFQAIWSRNGCQLYYNSSIVQPEDIPRSHMLGKAGISQQQQRRRRLAGKMVQASGSPKSEISEVGYFLGCGWSFHFTLDYPCLSGDLDDQVFMVKRTFRVASSDSSNSIVSPSTVSNPELPLCQLEDEAFAGDHKSTGRWVREEWPNRTICPRNYTHDPFQTKMFPITAVDPDHPHCWHRDDLSLPSNRCTEANCRLIPKPSKWNASSLHHEKEWMGVWRRYNCDYQEFTNEQLQQCVNKRRISSITLKGASIAAMAEQYLKVRIANIEFPEEAKDDQPLVEVVIDSLAWPHVIWRKSEQTWPVELQGFPAVDAKKEEHYFFTSFYASSEREPYVQVARAERFARLAEEIMLPKGYKMINAFELSAAFSFDTGGQGDGLHIIGPPMKAIMTKAFHHMCSDVVNGSTV